MNLVEIIGLCTAAGVSSVVIGKILSWRRIVPVDMVHVVQTTKKTTSYGKNTVNAKGEKTGNVYYKWPRWIPKLGVSVKELPIANFDIAIDNFPAFDKDRVPFMVDIRTFFRIADTNKAAERVDDIRHLREQLETIVQGAVRTIMAGAKLNEILENRSTYGKQFTDQVKNDLAEWGVETTKNIELMDIRDDNSRSGEVGPIERIMAVKQSEIEKESRVQVAKNQQMAKEQEIESERQIKIKEAEKEQLVGQRVAQKDQEVGIAKEKSKQQIAEQAKVTAEKDLEVTRVNAVTNANITQEKTLIEADTTRKTTIIKANQDKEKMIIDAEAERERIEIKADADKNAKFKEAEAIKTYKSAEAVGIKSVGEANADAEKQMQLARVTAETTLAEKIGQNKDYQEYLVNLEQVKQNAEVAKKQAEFSAEVGKAQAIALAKATVHVVANTGSNVQDGLGKVGGLFTPSFTTQIGAADQAYKNASGGKGWVDTVKEIIDSFALAKQVNVR